MEDDQIFLNMMKLFTTQKTALDTRKRIIRAIRAPITEQALAFLG